jgi:WD40 repeat protein
MRVLRATAFANRSDRFATLENQDVDLWDAATGRLQRTLADHEGIVRIVSFSPDEQRLASVYLRSAGDEVHSHLTLWDVGNGRRFPARVVSEQVSAAALLGDGRHLAVAEPEAIRVIDLQKGGEAARLEFAASGLRVSPNGRSLVAWNYRELRLYRLDTRLTKR